MSVNYCRTVEEVLCNSCGKISKDIEVEKTHFKEVEKNSFEVWVSMDCKCGGTYEYF